MSIIAEIIRNYTWSNLIYDLILVAISCVYLLLVILLPVYLKKKNKISKFTARKSVHFLAGLIVLIVPFFILPLYAVLIAVSMTILVFFSSKDSPVRQLKDLFESIGEEEEQRAGRLQGPIFYCISITLLITGFVLFAPYQLYFPISGILIMIVSDTLASIVGKKYGKIQLSFIYTRTKRTLEGSLTFFLSALILCFAAFLYFGLLNPFHQKILSINIVLTYSAITALAGTIVELLSPSALDDLTVPVVTTLMIYTFANFL